MMRIFLRTLIFLTLGAIPGCQFDPYAGDLTTEQPKKEDVIGIYQFKKQTITADIIDTLGQKSMIVLRPDGTYHAINIPNVFDGANKKANKYISATGTWKIETLGSVDNGWHIKPHWGIVLTAIDERLTSIGFMGDRKRYNLIVTFDDPDLGKVMIFSKS